MTIHDDLIILIYAPISIKSLSLSSDVKGLTKRSRDIVFLLKTFKMDDLMLLAHGNTKDTVFVRSFSLRMCVPIVFFYFFS